MEELNKKLAEWVGLKWTITFEFEDEDGYCHPFFTDSLDLCFKWLVPKLQELNYDILLEIEFGSWMVNICFNKSPYEPEYIVNNAETPALALCLAIEKLIKEV